MLDAIACESAIKLNLIYYPFYNLMTELLCKVVAKIEKLPEAKQNEIASRLLADLERESQEKLLIE
jgi:hypothetical protein